MKKNNYIIKFLIVLIFSVLFFMCTPAGDGSGSGGSGDKTTGFQNIWTYLNSSIPVTMPNARHNHSMVYIGNNEIILFGGYTGNVNGEIWKYNVTSNKWLNINPILPIPSARDDHAMVYIGNNKIILFGGSDTIGLNNETWEYNVTTNIWTNLNPAVKPSARDRHSMVYVGNNKIILFGGSDGSFTNDTWEYNIILNTWTNLNPSAPIPTSRADHCMVYIGNNKIILFGGDYGVPSFETWEYNITSNTWTDLTQLPALLPRVCNHSMVYTGDSEIILYGGYDVFSTVTDETWKYNITANTWTELNLSLKPSARHSHSMVYVGNKKIILFGGYDGSNNTNEVWEYK